MEEQLVSFETAKLAKEKGFSVGTNGCLVHYKTENKHHEDGTSGPFGWKKNEMTFDKSYIVNGRADLGDLSNSSYDCYELPTQSLLQKWLREVHMVRVYLIHSISGNFNFEIYIWDKPNTIGKWSRIGNISSSKTYEEALEKGLFQALKLI